MVKGNYLRETEVGVIKKSGRWKTGLQIPFHKLLEVLKGLGRLVKGKMHEGPKRYKSVMQQIYTPFLPRWFSEVKKEIFQPFTLNPQGSLVIQKAVIKQHTLYIINKRNVFSQGLPCQVLIQYF